VAEEKPFFDIPQQIEKNQIQEYLKKTFTKEPIDQDIDEINSELNYKKQNENIDKKKVYDPISSINFLNHSVRIVSSIGGFLASARTIKCLCTKTLFSIPRHTTF